MQLAIEQEKALWRQVANVVEGKHELRRNKFFRYVLIKDDPDQELFTHPPILLKLGAYLVDVYR